MDEPVAEVEVKPPAEAATSAEIVGVWTVIMVVVLPGIASGLFYTLATKYDPRNLGAIQYIFTGAGNLSLALTLAWMMKLKPSDIGIVKLRVTDFFLICAIGFGWSAAITQLERYFHIDQTSETLYDRLIGAFYEPAPGVVGTILFTLSVISAATGEEFLFRALLIPRIRRILKSRILAVLLSSLLFSILHLYQGPTSVFFHFLCSTVIGTLYAIVPRVIPFALGHALCNMLIFYNAYDA